MSQSDSGAAAGEVHTFLIADVRGYTTFTQVHGDELAGRLAARFAGIVEEVVEARDGRLLELRGDEALVVFVSPRQAVRAAMALQARFVTETLADPAMPLGVGIGVDAGEAVPVQDGYRGGALNLAARLCGIARAGETLMSGEAAHLARQVEGVRYTDRGSVNLKGLDQPVHVMRVAPEQDDPTDDRAFVALTRQSAKPAARRHQLRIVTAAVLVLLVALAGVTIGIRQSHTATLPTLSGNVVGRVSLASGRVVGDVPVGAGAGAVTSGDGSVWVANTIDGTVTRIDLRAPSAPADTISLSAAPDETTQPSAIAVGDDAVWVADADNRRVDRIDPTTNRVVATVTVGNGPTGLAVVGNDVWVSDGLDDTVSVIDEATDRVVATIPVGASPSAVAYGDGSIWVANAGSANVVRIDPTTHTPLASIGVGSGPSALVVSAGGVWVSEALAGVISMIDPAHNQVTTTRQVGTIPSGLAVAGNDLWVTDTNNDAITRVDLSDPASSLTAPLGSTTAGATVADGMW